MSEYCKIIELNGKKVVERFPRKYGITQEYYRTNPEYEVLKLLNNRDLSVPNTIQKTDSSILQEYI